MASASYKTGRWSKHLPASRIAKHYGEAYQDRTLMQLRQDVALVDAMLTTYTGSLKDTGKPLTLEQEKRVLNLVNTRKGLVEAEARRVRDLGAVMPVEQFRMALNLIGQVVLKHLADNREALADLDSTLRRVLLGKGGPESNVVEGVVTDGD